MINIGILLPRSTLYPSLGLDILNGLKTCLQQLQLKEEFKFFTDNIGFGTDEASIYAKAEKLLLQEDVDIAIVVADTRIQEMLQPLFAASNKLLLMVNFGVTLPESWQPAATTIVHSLNFCFHARLTGQLAVAEGGKEAVNIVSYYDGGYHQCYSLLDSHQQKGGIPCFTHITHFKESEFTLGPVNAFLAGQPSINTALCLFTGDMAATFYKNIPFLQQQYGLKLYVSPMMLDETLKDFFTEPLSIQNTKGYSPWLSSLDNENNRLFTATCEKAMAKQPNLFVLLGWETGLLLQLYFDKQKEGAAGATAIVARMKDAELPGPRGWLKLDAATQHTYGPSWLLQNNGAMELTIAAGVETIHEEWKAFTSKTLPQGESSSWRNTYLCI